MIINRPRVGMYIIIQVMALPFQKQLSMLFSLFAFCFFRLLLPIALAEQRKLVLGAESAWYVYLMCATTRYVGTIANRAITP